VIACLGLNDDNETSIILLKNNKESDPHMIDGLQQDNLTPAGWKALADKVEIHSAKGTVIAEDHSGQSYEYQSEFMKPESKETSADYWIWGCELSSSSE
jgi:hypothetical protein